MAGGKLPKTPREQTPKRRKKVRELLYTSAQFRPYVTALGQLALAWNGLHETLCLLFCTAMGGGAVNQFLAIWHALKNDRAQRDVLSASVTSNFMSAVPTKYVSDVTWLCKMADVLEEERNNALHAPLWAPSDSTKVEPYTALGHVRAKKLANKDTLFEFRWCRDRANALAIFAAQIDEALVSFGAGKMRSWPERPPWPARQGSNKPQQHRPRPRARQVPPPRSSRA